MKHFFLLAVLFVSASVAAAQTMPPVRAKTLTDAEVSLPDPVGRQVVILMVGFSHKSGDAMKRWSSQISADFRDDSRVGYFELPNLQGVPGFVKPKIIQSMRKDVSQAEQAHFVPVFDNKEHWKKFVNFSAADDAYLVVTAADGRAIWQAHGAYSEATYNALKQSVVGFLERSAPPAPKR